MDSPTPPGPPPTRRIRAVALLALVVALGAGAAFAVIALADASGSSESSTGWNTIAAVDFLDGDITLFDTDGTRIDRISTDITEALVHQVSASHLVVEGVRSDRDTIAIVDITTAEILDLDLGDDIARGDGRDLRVRPIPGADAFILGSDGQRGTAYVVTVDGEVVDIAREADWDEPFIVPGSVQASPDGSALAVFDAAGPDGGTAVIRVPELDVAAVDGTFISLSDDTFRTRVIGDDRRVEVATFDLSGERIDSFETDLFRIAIDGPGGELITASDDGEIVRWTSDGDAERLATFEGGDGEDFARLARTFGADPVIAVAGLDGELLLASSDGTIIDGIELDSPVSRFDFGFRCLPVITDTSIALVDVTTGDVLAEERTSGDLPPFVGFSAQDGCVISVFDADDLLLGPTETVVFDDRENLAGLSPDGSAYAVLTRDGELILRGFGDGEIDAVDLDAGEFARIFFVER